MMLISLSRSDYLPLIGYLEKNTLNSKVSNWAVETEQYQIKFEYITGIKITLADIMSRLTVIDPDTCQGQNLKARVWVLCISGVTQCLYDKESVTARPS